MPVIAGADADLGQPTLGGQIFLGVRLSDALPGDGERRVLALRELQDRFKRDGENFGARRAGSVSDRCGQLRRLRANLRRRPADLRIDRRAADRQSETRPGPDPMPTTAHHGANPPIPIENRPFGRRNFGEAVAVVRESRKMRAGKRRGQRKLAKLGSPRLVAAWLSEGVCSSRSSIGRAISAPIETLPLPGGCSPCAYWVGRLPVCLLWRSSPSRNHRRSIRPASSVPACRPRCRLRRHLLRWPTGSTKCSRNGSSR